MKTNLILGKAFSSLAVLVVMGQTVTASEGDLFIEKVYPLLKQKCFACHGGRPDKIKAGYDMRTAEGLLAGGDSGAAAIMGGSPEQSPFFVALTWDDEDLQMPPKENDRLNDEQIALIRRWIEKGARWSDPSNRRSVAWGDVTEDGMVVETSGGLDDAWTYRRYAVDGLWSYRPIEEVGPPREGGHPIDAFIDARQEEAGIRPAPRADKLDLLRRATFGLTGLPPSPEEVEAFIGDDGPDAFGRVIERLQDSPHYGEKMAQHWLDVVRYADTSGFSNDFERPTAWRYRDYVVRSFNADKPYDQFVREQLAGDEMEGVGGEGLIATGFLRMGPWEHTAMSVAAETRQQFLDDVTHSVGVTFLGQQLRCAKCHDHKFDPIPTQDYYRFQALFATVQFADRPLPFLESENTSQMETGKARLQRRLANADNRDKHLNQQVQRIVAKKARERGDQGMSEEERKQVYELAMKDQKIAVSKATRKQKMYYEREAKRYEPYAYTVYNGPARDVLSTKPITEMPGRGLRKGEPEPVHVLTGGSIASPAQEVSPGILSVVDGFTPAASDLPRTITDGMGGRRTELAGWIVHPDNPLTSRVIVNRVWQQLFSGQALVATPNDFGKMGARPTHPELPDFLARWFMDNGWSIKKLQRFIMASEAYQRAAAPADPASADRDSRNHLLSYFPPRRLQAEEIRDAMLAITGELNPEQGGPGTFPEINWEVAFQPRLVMGTIAPAYQPSPTRSERHRRSLYHFRYRSLPDPLLEVFNRPGSEMACDVRDETIIAPQAFTLFNSEFVHDRALALAALAGREDADVAGRLAFIFRRMFGREMRAEELELLGDHYRRVLQHHRAHTPVEEPLPLTVERESIEELTGEPFVMVEELDNLKVYERDLKPWEADAETRALAEVCLVLFNSNEFSFLY